MKKRTVGIIGCGNMGGAIARGISSRGIIPVSDVCLFDLVPGRTAEIAIETGCRKSATIGEIAASEILILAVKPSDLKDLSGLIGGEIKEQTIVSIMAGVGINEIVTSFGKEISVVRAMPNLGASLQKAVTCLTCNRKAEDAGVMAKVRDIFLSIGEVLEVQENKMDAVTAISGSGPAYLFSLAEAMFEASLEEGFSEEVSRKLVSGTLVGSAMLLEKSDVAASDLVRKVASKGGTTEAALSVFLENGFKDIVKKAIRKAKIRSEEMSGGKR